MQLPWFSKSFIYELSMLLKMHCCIECLLCKHNPFTSIHTSSLINNTRHNGPWITKKKKKFETIEKYFKWFNQVFMLYIMCQFFFKAIPLDSTEKRSELLFMINNKTFTMINTILGPVLQCLTRQEITHYKYWWVIKFWGGKNGVAGIMWSLHSLDNLHCCNF